MIDFKIINTKIENDILTITLDSASSVTKVYLDNVLNKKNMYSENDEDHNHVVNSPNISDNTITIDIAEYDSTSFIVNVVGSNNAVSIAIDQKNLYSRKVNMLVTFCNTCLDKHQKEKILMCDFKSRLLEYALANQLTEDAIDYYVDLCRLLEIPLEHTCCTYNRITNCRVCRSCSNGCCTL